MSSSPATSRSPAPRRCSRSCNPALAKNPSPPFRGEREGPAPKAWEGEVGVGKRSGIPHLTPTLSAPKGGEGELVADPSDIRPADWVERFLPGWAGPYARLARLDPPIRPRPLLFP